MKPWLDISKINEIVDSAIASPFYQNCNPIMIYGAGNIGKDVYRVLDRHGVRVAGFLDQKAVSGQQWNGTPVYLPDQDGLDESQRQQTAVIIAIHNREVNISPIIHWLKEQGYGKVISLVEFFDLFSAEMGDRFWLTSRMSYNVWENDIRKCDALWADQLSKDLYRTLIYFRLTGDYSVLPSPDPDHQYFSQDVPPWKVPLRFVDGGAYDGDTLKAFLTSTYSIQSVAAFEPDLVNFKKLSSFAAVCPIEEVFLWPCGIYSSTRQLQFENDASESSKIAVSGSYRIQTVALDDVLSHFKPNLIKLDIEGADYEGIIGAEKTIRKDRPGLAICLYHQPQHLWQIPLLLNNWGLGYQFYLRVHAFNDFDVVLYAISP
jgi:FkbM family methyltransferase